MTTTVTRGQSIAARRTGYLVAALVNAALLYVTFVQPGWRSLPFLTEETPQVLGLFTISLIVGLAGNLLYLAYDPPWLRSPGELLASGVGLATTVRVWQVFPFDFGGSSVDWAAVVRVVLIVAIAGTAIAVIVQASSLVRLVRRGSTAVFR